MRKAKLMLSAIAVFAVVGGAFAVKAAKSARVENTFYSIGPAGQCTVSFTTLLTTLGGVQNTPYFTKSTIASACHTLVKGDI